MNKQQNIIYKMKYLRLYEKFNIIDLIGDKSNRYWYIVGNCGEVIKILKKCGIDFGKDFHQIKMYGCFIQYDPNGYFIKRSDKFSFWQINDKESFKEAKETFESEGSIYQGEIRLEDGEIVIDTLTSDMEKYNL